MAKKKDDETLDESGDGSIAVNDAWTGMLAVSLLALVVGTGFLAYDYLQYSDQDPPKVPKLSQTPPGGARPPAPKAAEPPKDAK